MNKLFIGGCEHRDSEIQLEFSVVEFSYGMWGTQGNTVRILF